MKSFEPKIETRLEKGENVIIHAVFMRHGEKEHDPENPETGLTLKGEWDSRAFGQSRGRKGYIEPHASDTPRTIDTAKYATEQSPTRDKKDLVLENDLAFRYDPESDFLKKAMKIKRDVLGEDPGNLPEDELIKRMFEANSKQTDYYLSFGDQRPDIKTFSPVETASGIAKMVYDYIEGTSEIKSGSEIDLINATHDFNLAAFLKEAMIREEGGHKIRGFDSVDEIGGSFGFNEGFEILIKASEKGKKEIKLVFRGREHQLDMDRINELVEINNGLKIHEDE
jgi:hypothetical protein